MVDAAEFVRQMIDQKVLQFGDFVLKSGRNSPYFFNMGAIAHGAGLHTLGRAYANTILALPNRPDVVFGPAYKGIPIAVATAIALDERGCAVGVAYNRKETKDHGEGGVLVGAAIENRDVVVVDDVMTAGTAVTEAVRLIEASGANLMAVLVALDRCEILERGLTAIEVMAARLGVPVKSIASLADVMSYLDSEESYADARENLLAYQQRYCATIGRT